MTTIFEGQDVFDAGGRGLQHHGLRRANERAVLTLIGFNAGVSNAEISRLSGLAPQTVSAILSEIEEAGLIARGPVLRGRRGQPATPIYLRAEGAFSIGVEIGWHHVEVLLIDLHARVRASRRWLHDFPDARTILDQVGTAIIELVATLPDAQRERVRGVGLALPANMAENISLIAAPSDQRALWGSLDIACQLQTRCGLEVSLFNDGNAACWAQLIAFPKPRPANFIYFHIGRYIAAGIVGEGTLWEGPSGNSADLGAMHVSTGSGALQPANTIASVVALEKRLVAAGFEPPACIDEWDWDQYAAVTEQWIGDSSHALAQVVFNTSTVMETALVVIDGLLPEPIGTQLSAALEQQLQALTIPAFAPPKVIQGHLGALAPATGAAELTLYRLIFSRTLADLVG